MKVLSKNKRTILIKTYYALTKPGIIYGNAVTAIGGFLLASKQQVNLGLLIATIAGTSLVIASGCVYNNYLDRGIDAKMARTKKRALVQGMITTRSALLYATALGLVGFLVLGLYTNTLTTWLGLAALVVYVVFYGIGKRRSVHGTLIGSVAGAAPPVASYTAVTGRLDSGALLLFLILVCWQMPHFYAIAIYRLKDYKAAGLPVWPIKKGLKSTKIQMTLYIVAFMVATTMLSVFGYTGYTYLVVMLGLSLTWLWLGFQGFRVIDDRAWARKMFLFSLLVIVLLSLMWSIDGILP